MVWDRLHLHKGGTYSSVTRRWKFIFTPCHDQAGLESSQSTK